MLALEPVLSLVTLYQSFIYGILYLVFVSYPIEFRAIRQFSLGISGLFYLGLLIGVSIGAIAIIIHTRTTFARAMRANEGVVIPEQRLPLMIVGGCILPIGVFIFAWTSNPQISWLGQVIGSIPMGMGMYMVFVQCFNYIIDVYPKISNSAIAPTRSSAASLELDSPSLDPLCTIVWVLLGLVAYLGLSAS